MKYIIGTGYHARPGRFQSWFWRVWAYNTLRHFQPVSIAVIGTGGNYPDNRTDVAQWIYPAGDLGHLSDLISGTKPYKFNGGSGAILLLAMFAYASECDLIFKEQDCLAFGSCAETMYSDIGSHGMIFGRAKRMPSALALFLVKHAFIPEFVRLYLGTEPETTPGQMPESKMARLLAQHPNLFATYSFGVDRDRPLPEDRKTSPWYAQKFTSEELRLLQQEGLIPEVFEIPEIEGQFSN